MRAFVVTVALLALGAGCSDTPTSEDTSWQRSDDPVATTDLSFAIDSTVHLAEGQVDTGVVIAAFVVAGDGVYFVEDEDPDDGHRPSRGTHQLRFSSRDGDVVDTGVDVLVETLRASPNGRYLAAIDMASGKEDAYGTPQAALVVWDLRAGDEIIRSTAATGDPAEDDFAALYPELEMKVASIDDDGLLLDAVGTWTFDFRTGEGERIADGAGVPGPGGTRLPREADRGRVELHGWVDDVTAYGVLDGEPPALATCDLPSGGCTEVADTAGRYVILPNGLANAALDLRNVDE